MPPVYIEQSAAYAVAVTPSDTVPIASPSGTSHTKGIYVGGAGNLNVVMPDGSTVLFTAIGVGVIHWLAVKSVKATSTTATAIVALY